MLPPLPPVTYTATCHQGANKQSKQAFAYSATKTKFFREYFRSLWSIIHGESSHSRNDIEIALTQISQHDENSAKQMLTALIVADSVPRPYIFLKRAALRKPPEGSNPSLELPTNLQRKRPIGRNPARALPIHDPYNQYKEFSAHPRATDVLTARYHSRCYVVNSEMLGLQRHLADHNGPEIEEIQKRVSEDILWFSKRFQAARLGEPSDEDLIWWFAAAEFEHEEDIGTAITDNDNILSSSRRLFMEGLMFGNMQSRK